jgi:hypothetical protein
MDLSKLPKLSDTKSQTPAKTEPAPAPVQPVQQQQNMLARQPGVGVDIWISLVIGILLLMMGRNFGQWAIATLKHEPFHTGYFWPDEAPYNGREETYFELIGFTALSDMGIFLFGAMLLAEAGAKTLLVLKPGAIGRGALILAAFLTLGTTLLNIYACFKLFDFGVVPTLSALAVAFGGWILFDEWATLQRMKPARN